MKRKAPGKSYRKGMTFVELIRMFPDDAAAKEWFTAQRWPHGPFCPYCGSFNVQVNIKHRTMSHRCRDCQDKPFFSLKIGTILEGSKLGYQKWAIAIYLLTTNLKGVSSMKLHRDLGVTQKTAWHLAHRIRKTFERSKSKFSGPVEVDETYVGGLRKNMTKAKREALEGRGASGKIAVAGAKDRDTNQVSAAVVNRTDGPTLKGFIRDNVSEGATVYTDENTAYLGLEYPHDSVKHSFGEYVRGETSTQGIESFWSMLKRAHKGTFHNLSGKHLQRYVTEFSGRHNQREDDTIDQMGAMVRGMNGKRLRYRELVR